jgi:hypothetical protein
MENIFFNIQKAWGHPGDKEKTLRENKKTWGQFLIVLQ